MATITINSKPLALALMLLTLSLAYASDDKPDTNDALEKLTHDPLVFKNLRVLTDVVGVSTQPYVDSFKEGEVPKPDPKDMPSKDQYRGMGFPVTTPDMKPGNVGANEGDRFNVSHMIRPLAIVGDDPISQTWLKQNATELRERRATVFVVNVENSERFKLLESLAPGVYFQASNGQRFVDEYNVKHYPFYISAQTGVVRNAD